MHHMHMRAALWRPGGLMAVTRYTSPMKAAYSIRCPHACACVQKCSGETLMWCGLLTAPQV